MPSPPDRLKPEFGAYPRQPARMAVVLIASSA